MTTTTPLHEKSFLEDEKVKLPRPFILRRLHSLLGLWLVLYLCEHLLVNSQAALFFEDDGEGFIAMVNRIHQLPYLPLVEILFLAVPFAIHGIWGVIYLRSAKYNSSKTEGTLPALPQYKRNHAYTWQRITSWLLLFGVAAHVIHMRFLVYPELVHKGIERNYLVPLSFDPALYGVAHKLDATLYSQKQLVEKQIQFEKDKENLQNNPSNQPEYYFLKDAVSEEEEWLKAASKKPLKSGQVLASAPYAGTAFLLILRETFKSPAMVILYSILVVGACFHAFNGLWTFLISWGITLTRRSQKVMRRFSTILMLIVTCLGLMAVWGSFFQTI